MKTCRKCQETQPLTGFYRDKSKRDGYESHCKLCREGRTLTPEQVAQKLERKREWKRNNPGKVRAERKRYKAAHPEKVREQRRAGAQRQRVRQNLARYGTSQAPRLRGGDAVSYKAAHSRVYSSRGRAVDYVCVDCGEQAKEWSYRGGSDKELTEVRASGLMAGSSVAYSPEPNDYDPRCVPCHTSYDKCRASLLTAA